jgi:cellulose synthase/poly-beta-1,6-N-acetylglucosamine synthase-like glycosyltransferase
MFSLYAPTSLVLFLVYKTDFSPHEELALYRLIVLLLIAPIIVKYVVHLFIAPWYPAVESLRARKHTLGHQPSVSVLIPAWNEEVGIVSTIKSVLSTHYPLLEIIIINDGSTDNTNAVVTTFLEKYFRVPKKSHATIIYKCIPNSGKARALNTALSLATGEFILTIDADSTMTPQAITNMIKRFTNDRVAAVAGNVAIGNRRQPIGLIQQLEYLYGFYFKRADSLLNAVYIVGGAAAAYRRQVVIDLGGFDENSITEDIELSTRLQDKGYHVRYAADAIVYTEGPSNIKGLCQQRLRWKFGRLQTFYTYRHLFFSIKRQHNRYLTFLILPIALFAEILLFFQGFLMTAFFAYTFYTSDYAPLAFVILLLTSVICLQIISDPNRRYHRNLFLLAPSGWVIFYIVDLVEYQALVRSIWKFITKKSPSWQVWQRVGVFGSD